MTSWDPAGQQPPLGGADPLYLHTDKAHPARVYDYLLGGKDNYTVDRDAADHALAAFPTLRTAAQENRAFLVRAVRFLAREVGIRQFLDIGSGLPTVKNVHEVAQSYLPEARVVYVDNDPIVLVHGNTLLAHRQHVSVIHGDFRRPESILDEVVSSDLLDMEQPIALIANAVLHFIADKDDPVGILGRLRGAMVPGSYVVLSHATADLSGESALGVQAVARMQGIPMQLRSRAEFETFFAGLRLVEPGIDLVSHWRSTLPVDRRPSASEVSWYGGVGEQL